jgi:hypothetical protein
MEAKPRRRAVLIATTAAFALAAPAAAQAATYAVAAGGGTCGDPDLTCGSLAEAAAAVAPGDTVTLPAGQFSGATFTDPNVTITGPAVTPGGLPVTGILGTVAFSGAGAASSLGNVVVSTNDATPAVDVTGTANVALHDALLASASGPALRLANADASSVRRTQLFSAGAQTAAIQFSPTAGAAKTLTLDSTILAGGGGGAGLRVDSSGAATGTVTVAATHITVAGSSNGFVLNANTATLGGGIAATVSDSILQGANVLNPNSLAVVGNTVTLDTAARVDTTTPPATLFVNPAGRNYHLLYNSPAIGKGAAAAAGDRDVDGQLRGDVLATDLGADEFLNSPPTARIAASSLRARQNQAVTFSAAGSRDPDGPLTQYRWTFSDGATATTTTPTTTHAFKTEGPASAFVSVVDASGSPSLAEASVGLTIIDGLAPLITIDKPTANQSIALTRTTRRTVTRDGRKRKVTRTTRTRIAFAGRSLDRSGVRSIVLSIRQVSRAKKKATTKKKKATSSQSRTCRWLSPNRGMVARSCSKPVQIKAKLAKNGSWTYTVPAKRKLTAGTWEVAVAGTDTTGLFGNINPKGKVRFRLK